jgi:hypothetical protein
MLQVLNGQSAHRIAHLVNGTTALLQGNFTEAGYYYADSSLNVLAQVGNIVSDAGSVLKHLFYSTARSSSRIQICTSNLLESNMPWRYKRARAISPMLHVGVLVDGGTNPNGYEGRAIESGGGSILAPFSNKTCQNVPILSDESESIAIERLHCHHLRSEDHYSRWGHNCGGYAKEMLERSGLGYPLFANLGIGADFSGGEEADKARAQRQADVAACDQRIETIRSIIAQLENGQTSVAPLFENMPSPNEFTEDVKLQFLISAVRGKNEKNITYIFARGTFINNILYFDDTKEGMKIRTTVRPMLEEMFRGLDQESLNTLKWMSPGAAAIYIALRDPAYPLVKTPLGVSGSHPADPRE